MVGMLLKMSNAIDFEQINIYIYMHMRIVTIL